MLQIAITATVYLKQVHSFFAMCPLLKGVFMKMTMNLNNSTVQLTVTGAASPANLSLASVSVAVGGVCPIMISSAQGTAGTATTYNGGYNLVGTADGNATPYLATLSVGGRCLNSTVAARADYLNSPLAQSVYLYVPAYTFNPVFEQAYLSSPIKQIKYTDIYQYQVLNVAANNGQFNSLITNGIANIKSVLS